MSKEDFEAFLVEHSGSVADILIGKAYSLSNWNRRDSVKWTYEDSMLTAEGFDPCEVKNITFAHVGGVGKIKFATAVMNNHDHFKLTMVTIILRG